MLPVSHLSSQRSEVDFDQSLISRSASYALPIPCRFVVLSAGFPDAGYTTIIWGAIPFHPDIYATPTFSNGSLSRRAADVKSRPGLS